jgi:5-methylcytosine-specific restriction endonuclease McrA
MSNFVFVLDSNKKPLNPCRPITARKLLTSGKAKVFRRYPFTIIINKQVHKTPKPIELKIDPGSKVTGIALKQGDDIIFGAELHHRGFAIKSALDSRRAIRRSKRNRKTRYRQARFLNRKRKEGWLPPSLQHRVDTTMTWVNKLCRLAPITSISQELVKFDTQKIQNPEVSGIEYQQGELAGYEVREYLLEKWGRKCAYCKAENLPLQVEHIKARANGGTNRVSNLCLACEKCNLKKGTQDVRDFLSGNQSLLTKILGQARQPLKDATAVNSTRWSLFNNLKSTGLEVLVGSGGQTKYNRVRLGFEKHHWIDAACVGNVQQLNLITKQPLQIISKGWGSRQMLPIDKYGFPRKGYAAKKKVPNWNTGDIINVVSGKYIGLKGKRLKSVRFKGSFGIQLDSKIVVSVAKKHLNTIHRKDGYEYKFDKQ